MREIKFRAWGKKRYDTEPEMDYSPSVYDCECFGEFSMVNLNKAFANGDDADNDNNATPKIFMQFTGLTDKHGKDIYEGDIVSDNPRFSDIPCHGLHDSAEIVKCEEYAGSDDMGIDVLGYPMYWESFEVIGNIYENPELLNQKEND